MSSAGSSSISCLGVMSGGSIGSVFLTVSRGAGEESEAGSGLGVEAGSTLGAVAGGGISQDELSAEASSADEGRRGSRRRRRVGDTEPSRRGAFPTRGLSGATSDIPETTQKKAN